MVTEVIVGNHGPRVVAFISYRGGAGRQEA